jgi:pyrroloquinoline quinone (PQQ) biosynthesis protein C
MSRPAESGDDAGRPFDAFVAELADFVLSLPAYEGPTCLELIAEGRPVVAGAREWCKDFWAFGESAVQRIAGQLSHVTDPVAFRAVAQAFSTEAGWYLTPNHMDLWAAFCADIGIPRAELEAYEPISETLMCIYTQEYWMTFGTETQALAAFHLGVPPRVRDRVSDGITMGGMGGGRVGGAGFLGLVQGFQQHYGLGAERAMEFIRLHGEIEPFELGEAWSYIRPYVRTRLQQEEFLRAYVLNVLAQRAREGALVRHIMNA